MKAIVHRRYGSPDVLELCDVDEPVAGDDDVLVRVHAAGVNPADWHSLNGTPYLVRTRTGLRKPKQPILGLDIAGEVVRVGRNITRFQPGDAVFGENHAAYAEYVCVPEQRIVDKPANITFEEAAAVPIAALTALQGLRDHGMVQPGQRVLVNGASGGVGTFAVQIANHLGAHVTAVCSTRNVEMVRSLGADEVIDYTNDDFTTRRDRFDVVLDTVGNHSLSSLRRTMNSNGRYVNVGAPMGNWISPLTHMAKVMVASLFGRPTMKVMLARQTPEDLIVLRDLLAAGGIRSVIDRTYPLADAADALRAQGEGHARGKTVITIGAESLNM